MRWSHVGRGAAGGYGPDAVTMISTPLYSNTTLVSLIPTLAGGGTAVLMERFDVARFLALAKQGRPYEQHMVIEDVPGKVAEPIAAALQYQQREQMERGRE